MSYDRETSSAKIHSEARDAGESVTRGIGNWVPPGLDHRQEVKWTVWAFSLSLLYSLRFFLALFQARDSLFLQAGAEKILDVNAVMPDFILLLRDSLIGFPMTALGAAALLAYHYFYHFQGSKSIYLMRRLPRRLELVRRCAALPLLTAAAALLAAGLLLALYFGIYLLVTPETCLSSGQWDKIWNVLR